MSFSYLLYSPVQKEGIPYFPQQFKPPGNSTSSLDNGFQAKDSSLFRVPEKLISVYRGDITSMIVEGDGIRASQWLLNNKKICEGLACQINTQTLPQETLHLDIILEFENELFKYRSYIQVKPKNYQVNNTALIVNSVQRTPFQIINKNTPYFEVTEGLAFIKNGEQFSPEDIITPIPLGAKIRTLGNSSANLIIPDQLQVSLDSRTQMEFLESIVLKSGSARFKSSSIASIREIIVNNDLKILMPPSSDFIVSIKGNSVHIIPINKSIRIVSLQNGGFSFLTSHGEQTLQSQGLTAEKSSFILFPGQIIRYKENKLHLFSNSYMNMTLLYENLAPDILDSKISEAPKSKKNQKSESGSNQKSRLEVKSISQSAQSNEEEGGSVPKFCNPIYFKDETNNRDNPFFKSRQLENFERGEGYFQLGLSHRAIYFFEKDIFDNKNQNSWQRLVEIYLLKKDFEKAEESLDQWEDLLTESQSSGLIDYYRGVIEHLQNSPIAAKNSFKNVIWRGADTNIITSAQSFIDYYENNKTIFFGADGFWLNSNNVLKVPDSNYLSSDIRHRASQGFSTRMNLDYLFYNDSLVTFFLLNEVSFKTWLRPGLNEAGFSKIATSPEFTFKNAADRYIFSPYVGKSFVGSHAGLDHFGIKLTLKNKLISIFEEIFYDHSRNLDPDPDGEKLLDPFFLELTRQEDRSVQRQILGAKTLHSDKWSSNWQLELWKYRYDLAKVDDHFGVEIQSEYRASFFRGFDYSIRGRLRLRSGSERTDTLFSITPAMLYRLGSISEIESKFTLENNSSNQEERTYQEQLLQIGISLKL